MAAMVELFCDSFAKVPNRIVLDIDDTEDRVHGHQQLALFHAIRDDTNEFLGCGVMAVIESYQARVVRPVLEHAQLRDMREQHGIETPPRHQEERSHAE
jgi:hypothetical protein